MKRECVYRGTAEQLIDFAKLPGADENENILFSFLSYSRLFYNTNSYLLLYNNGISTIVEREIPFRCQKRAEIYSMLRNSHSILDK